ncbi:MAG TPA: 16S rRNA (guanine(966)-N(2))-methyltransferase RsmD [Desulfuromonadales bacterium]|nr:16S rRNA (guanine(966)-N(2))-methyltransferase RsmD [Desulfuromonadales bacterium]
MRVIAGTCRGKKLSTPPGVVTRPTSDRVKEALFSILTSRIDFSGIRALDICAGTGSLGIEAISRGADFCCFIESNRSVVAILDKNLADSGCKNRSTVLHMDAVTALRRCAGREKHFDLVFFDPPYASDLYQVVPAALATSDLLAPAAILVIECSVRNELPDSYGVLRRFDRREYGDTAIDLFTVGG